MDAMVSLKAEAAEAAELKVSSVVNGLVGHFETIITSLENRATKQTETLGIHLDDGLGDEDMDLDDVNENGISQKSASFRALLTTAELTKIQNELLRANNENLNALSKVPVTIVKTILSHLDSHVLAGTQIRFLEKGMEAIKKGKVDSWLSSGGEGKKLAQELKTALQAAELILTFFTAQGIDRKTVTEEPIIHCCDLLKHVLQGNLVHAFLINAEGNDVSSSTSKGTGGSGSTPKNISKNMKDQIDNGNTAPVIKNEKESEEVTRVMVKPLSKSILLLCESGGLLPFMEKLEILVQTVRLDDQLVLSLINTSMTILPLQCETNDVSKLIPIHQHALSLLVSLFGHYEHHRFSMIDDLFPIMLKLPTSKKFHRMFKLNHLSKTLSNDLGMDSIQTVSALILLLVQSCVPDDMQGTTNLNHSSSSSSAASSSCVDLPLSPTKDKGGSKIGPLRESFRVSAYLVKCFLQRCQKKDESSEYRPLLTNFVEDLLAACLLPDWPAAETLLQTLTHALTQDLTYFSNSCKDEGGGDFMDPVESSSSSSKAVSGNSQYVSIALELLGRICTRLREVVRLDREFPLVFPDAVQLMDTEASPNDDDQVIGCPCGISVDTGGFMLDCDRCHRWFHGKCVSVSADYPPEEWYCGDCSITVLLGKQREELNRKRDLQKKVSSSLMLIGDESDELIKIENEEEDEALDKTPKSSKKKKSKKSKKTTTIEIPETNEVIEQVEANVEEKDIFRQLLLNYLNSRARLEPWMLTARRYHLVKWLQDYLENDQRMEHSSNNNLKNENDEININYEAVTTTIITTTAVHEHFADQFHLSQKAEIRKADWDIALNAAGTARIQRSLIVKGNFVGQFDQLLSSLLQLLGSSVPTLRARVVKAVSSIVDADPVLMTNEHVRTAITQRFYDSSISVRQAAVDLVGKYALLTPELFEQYHEALSERLVDRGVSVRKSVVKILRDALLAHPDHFRRSKICRMLVHRASSPKEEDSIKDLIRRTFEQLWFDDRVDVEIKDESFLSSLPSSNVVMSVTTPVPVEQSMVGDELSSSSNLPKGWHTESSPTGLVEFVSPSGTKCNSMAQANEIFLMEQQRMAQLAPPRPSSSSSSSSIIKFANNLNTKTEMQEMRIRASAAQIVEVVSGVSNTEWLVELLKSMLFGAGEGTKNKKEQKKRREFVSTRCELLVNALIEFLLMVYENDENESNLPFKLDENDSKLSSTLTSNSSRAEGLVACMTTLHVFCKSNPSLMMNHIETLLPFLEANNHVNKKQFEELICTKVSNMLTWSLPLLPENKRDVKLLSNTAMNLQKLTYKFGPVVVHAAVECLAVLTSFSNLFTTSSDPMMKLAQMFYKVLFQNISVPSLNGKAMANVQRGLVVLGAICRYRKQNNTTNSIDDDDDADDEDEDEEDTMGDDIGLGGSTSKQLFKKQGTMSTLSSELTELNLKSNCFQIFVGYLSNSNESIAQNALRGLSSQLIGSPRLMLVANRNGIVAQVLNHSSSLLRLEALISCREILVAEEKRIESGQAREQMISRLGDNAQEMNDQNELLQDAGGVQFDQSASIGHGALVSQDYGEVSFNKMTNKQVQGDQDSESSAVGGVLSEHYRNILSLLFDHSPNHGVYIRQAASKVLAVLLRQGLVNPLEVLPYVVALLGETSSLETRHDALRLLLIEDEKYPEFLKTRMLEGIALAYSLQKQILGTSKALIEETLPSSSSSSSSSSFNKQSSIFAGIYSQCIRSNRIKRFCVLKGILNLFEQPKRFLEVQNFLNFKNLDEKVKNECEEELSVELDLGFLCFACETLCYLPYDVQEEPLYLIYHINRFVSYQGSALLENFKSELRQTGTKVVDSDDEEDENVHLTTIPVTEDDDECVTLSKKRRASSKPLKKNTNVEETNVVASPLLRKYALESFSTCLLLYVKHFLKDVYKLTDARCREYKPSESTKATEKAIYRPEDMPVLTLPDAGALARSKHNLTLTDAIHSFNEFKKLMNQDSSDFCTISSSSSKLNVENGKTPSKKYKKSSLSSTTKKTNTKSKTKKPLSSRKKRKLSSKGSDGSDVEDDDSDYGN